MLIKHDLPVNKEETEKCDTLRYSWEKLQVQTSEVQTELLQVQPQFKSELIENVKTFNTDCSDFYSTYDTVSFVWLLYKYMKTSIIHLYYFLNFSLIIYTTAVTCKVFDFCSIKQKKISLLNLFSSLLGNIFNAI